MGGKTNAGPMMPYQGSTTVQSIPPEVLARYNAVNARAEAAAAQPFQKYSSDTSAFVAPLTQTQQYGIQNVNAAQGMAQPYYQAGTGAIGQGMGAYQQGMGALQGIAPQMAADQSVAGISTPFYQTAQRYTQTAATAPGGFQAGTPYLGVGAGLAGGAAQMTSPVGQEQINRYMSPYLQAVADPTMAFMKQQQEQQMAGQTGQAIRQGAFGGDRAGIAAATLAAQQQMAGAKTYGDIMQQGYGQALGSAFQAQQAQQADLARQLAAGQAMGQFGATAGQLQQADLARQLQAGAQMGQLGTAQRQAYETQQQIRLQDLARQMQGAGMMGQMGAGLGALGQAYGQMGAGAQQAALQGAQAQLSAGTLEQQTGQAGLQALYNQFLQERGYPYQQAQFLANIAMGTGALSGGTTTGYTSQQAQYQPYFQGFSDERLKEGLGAAKGGRRHVPPEVVGKTFDGQNIYRYKKIYRDEPELGLMADEVEDRHPEAVGRSHGYQTVDYKRATDDAVRLGGAVTSGGDFARGGYADGGMPIGEHVTERYIDPSSLDADMRRILASQKAGLGKLGAGLTGGVYGGAGAGTPGSSGYVPQGGLSAPSRANLPEAMRVSAVQSAPERSSALGAIARGADVGQKLFDPKKGGLFTEKSPFKSEDASNWEKAQSVLGLFKSHGGSAYALGGPSSGYDKEAGEEDPIGEALKVAQTPSKSNIPSPQAELPRRGGSEKGGFLDDLGSAVDTGSKLVSIGTAAAKLAPFLMSMSDRRMKEGLGRAAFQDGGPEDSNKPEEDSGVWKRMIGQESGGKQFDREGRTLMSPKGAAGIAQVMPGTAPEAARLANVPFDRNRYLTDPAYNEALGKAYFNEQKRAFGDEEAAAAAYNAGPGRVRQAIRRAQEQGGNYLDYLPRETQNYVANVIGTPNVDLKNLPAGAREFRASENAAPPQGLSNAAAVAEPRKKLGFMEDIEQNPQHLIVPFLSGLGAMARSQSRQPIGAILEGLGAGAERYMEVPRIEEETEKIRTEQDLNKAQAGTTRTTGLKELSDIASTAIIRDNDGRVIGVRVYRPGSSYPEQISLEEYYNAQEANRPYLLAPAGGEVPGSTPPAKIGAIPGSTASESALNSKGTLGGEKEKVIEEIPVSGEKLSPTDLSEEEIALAKKFRSEENKMANTALSQYKDIYTPQQEKAEAARDLRNQVLPMSAALSALPKTGKLSPGPLQAFMTPLVQRVNDIARKLNFERPFDENIVANSEEAKKYLTQLQTKAAQVGDQRSFAALDAIGGGYPSNLNSTKGLAALLAGVVVDSRKEIDKHEHFQKFRELAGGQRAPMASASWASLDTKYDKGRQAMLQKDKEVLEKLFYETPKIGKEGTFIDAEGKPTKDQNKATTWASWVIKNAGSMTPGQVKQIESIFKAPGILRYLGV